MNWEQLKAIVWLRWRLSRNLFARAGALNNVLSILLLALLVVGGVASGLGGFFLGLLALPKLQPGVLLLVWDGAVFAFLFFWMTSLLVEIQRSESIDLPKLLHLPVTLRQVFVFNYVVSHFTPGIVLLVPGMAAAGLGLAFGVGAHMAWVIPLALSFVFMVSAWTYCLRGWLAALMVNKRRRRAVIVWITIGFILVGQLPNLLLNSGVSRPQGQKAAARSSTNIPDKVLDAHLIIPVGWVGYGAMSLRQQTPWPALGGIVGGGLLGILGLIRAYRTTLRFYQGAEQKIEPKPAARRKINRRLLVERELPWAGQDTAALTMATLRSLLRAPEVKMALVVPVVLVVVLGGFQLTRAREAPAFVPPLAAVGAAILATFSLIQNMSNIFGLDRDGFRALVLLPVRGERILLAKNLALFPFVGVIGIALLGLAGFVFKLKWTTFLAGLLQIPAAYFAFSVVGNLASVLTPYRLASGTLQAKKPKAVVMLAVFGTMLVMPVVMAPVLLPPMVELLLSLAGQLPWVPVNLLGSIAVLAAVLLVYRGLLPSQGRLYERREQAILREVTEHIE